MLLLNESMTGQNVVVDCKIAADTKFDKLPADTIRYNRWLVNIGQYITLIDIILKFIQFISTSPR